MGQKASSAHRGKYLTSSSVFWKKSDVTKRDAKRVTAANNFLVAMSMAGDGNVLQAIVLGQLLLPWFLLLICKARCELGWRFTVTQNRCSASLVLQVQIWDL